MNDKYLLFIYQFFPKLMQWQRKHFMKVTEEKLHAITLYDYLKDRCLLESTNLKLHLGKFVS